MRYKCQEAAILWFYLTEYFQCFGILTSGFSTSGSVIVYQARWAFDEDTIRRYYTKILYQAPPI